VSVLAGGREIQVLQFPAGHSNLTYLIRTHIPASEYVLRRAPLGPLAARAHDMVREFRVLSAVHPHYPLAPQPVTVCEDASIIGTPFFVMEAAARWWSRGTASPASIATPLRRRHG
jgi:aminoglycoside phosphotransferase (APT) family kinase protein